MTRSCRAFDRSPIDPSRVRHIDGSFAFLPHRFLRNGFWACLDHHEILLYVLLVLVADRHGMSFYSDDRIASILRIFLDQFLCARAGLLRKNLIAYDPFGPRYQILSLPVNAVPASTLPNSAPDPAPTGRPAHVSHIIRDYLARLDDPKP